MNFQAQVAGAWQCSAGPSLCVDYLTFVKIYVFVNKRQRVQLLSQKKFKNSPLIVASL